MSGFRVLPVEGTPLWAVSASYWSPKLNEAARSVPGTRAAARSEQHLTGRYAHVGYPDAIELLVERLRAKGLNCDDPPVRDDTYAHMLPASYEGSRDYQKIGIDFLISNAGAGALLADDMGTGKGHMATRACRALRRKTIIVCPAHVRGVWERPAGDPVGPGELAKWWPAAKVFKPYGLKATPIPADTDVVVIHYDIAHAWVAWLLVWANGDLTIVFDESHTLLNATSRRSKACAELARAARGRIALTGTPPTDRVKDLHNMAETISPGRFGDFFPYGIRYCNAHKIDVAVAGGITKTVWDFSGKSNLEELRRRLDWFTLRRTKREVLKELPALQRQVVDVEVPTGRRTAMLASIIKDKKRMRAALDSAADAKMKHVLALIRGHLEEGKRVVVGTYRRAVCERICAVLGEDVPAKFIHGGVPLPRRGKIIDDLKHVDGPCVLVANIDATSTGIDLTFASVAVIAELVWEPRDLVQFEARLHRMNQKDAVMIQYVIARGTGDELIAYGVVNKLDNWLDLVEKDSGDGLKEAFSGDTDAGLDRLGAALKKMGQRDARRAAG